MNGNDNNIKQSSYWLLALVVLALALAGYVGYVLYPRFDLPAVTGASLFVLSAAAGLASFFSPCSFPLLLTLLARQVGGESEKKERQPLPRALRFASALSLGATVFLLLAGAGIALGGGALFAQVTFTSTAGRIIRLVVGSLLVLLGLIQTELLPVSFHGVEKIAKPLLQRQAELRREAPVRAFFLFGFAYLIAGFG